MGNKLEYILRSFFKDELSQADNWNTPSPMVWENIEQELKENNKSRSGFLWISFGLMAFVIIGLLLIRQCSLMDRPSNRQLTSSFTFLQKEEKTIGLHNELELKKNNAGNTNSLVKPTPAFEGIKDRRNGPPNTRVPTQVKNAPYLRKNAFISFQKLQNKKETVSSETFNNISSNEIVHNSDHSKNTTNLLPIKSISPLRSADLFAELAGFSSYEGAGHILVPIKKKLPSWVIITDLTIGNNRVDANFLNTQNKDAFDTRKTLTYGIGMRVEYFPNSRFWGLGTGLQYRHVRLLSDYGMSLNYTSQNEHQNPDGHFDNTYHSNMPSLFGEVSAELALLRLNSSVVDEGTPFDLNLTMEHQLDFLSVPFYTIIRTGRGPFRFYARTGFTINYLVSQPTSFVSALKSNHEAIHHRHSTLNASNDNDRGLHRWQLGVLLGAGLEYQIGPSWSLGVEPYFSRNITPVYQNRELSSATSLLGSSLSLRYNFK